MWERGQPGETQPKSCHDQTILVKAEVGPSLVQHRCQDQDYSNVKEGFSSCRRIHEKAF